jgi:sugar lactone lactonase YvrE
LIITDFSLVFDANVTLLETPVWDNRTKRLYCTDLFAGDVYAYEPSGGSVVIYRTGGGAIGSAIPCSDENKLLCALEKGLCLYDMTAGSLSVVADPNGGNSKNRYNDTRVDAKGRIFASTVSKLYGTSDYKPDMLGDFYMVDTDGSVKAIVEGINQYNCIVWNAANTEMFVIDTYNSKLLSFDYDIAYGPVSEPKQRLDLSGIGMPDGINIDSNDTLYICHWAGKISVWDKTLSFVRIMDFPVDQVCCGGFGGEALKDFYVATARYAYTPEQMGDRRGAGGLFRADMETAGTGDHFYPIKQEESNHGEF